MKASAWARGLRLPRRRGGARRATGRPGWCLAGAGPRSWPPRRGVVRWHVSLTHTDQRGHGRGGGRGRRPAGWPTGAAHAVASRMQPVLTVAEMRAVDAAAAGSTPLDAWSSGPARRWPSAPSAARRRPTADGWWWSPARATTGPTAGWRPAPGPARGAGWRWSRPGAPGRPRTVRPGDRRRLRHRVPGRLPGPGGAGRGRRCWPSTSPRGCDGDTGAAVGRARGGRPHGHLRRAQARAAPGRRRRPGRRVEVADIGLPAGDRADRPGRRRRRRGVRSCPAPATGNKWPARRAGGGRVPGHGGGGRAVRPRRPSAPGPGMVRLGVPGGRARPQAPATEAVGVRLPGEGWAAPVLGRAPVPGRWSSARASGGPRHRAEVRRLVAESPVPVVVDADGLFALGGADAAAPGRTARPRWCSPPTTASSPAWPASAPGPDRMAAARRLAAPDRGGGAAEGAAHRGGRPRPGRVLLAAAGSPAPGHGRHRRRAVGGHRRLRGPGVPPLGPPRWPPTSTAGPPRSARPRAWWPGTCPTWWPAGCSDVAAAEGRRWLSG